MTEGQPESAPTEDAVRGVPSESDEQVELIALQDNDPDTIKHSRDQVHEVAQDDALMILQDADPDTIDFSKDVRDDR